MKYTKVTFTVLLCLSDPVAHLYSQQAIGLEAGKGNKVVNSVLQKGWYKE